MLIEAPDLSVIHTWFDLLLEKVYPLEFPTGWWQSGLVNEQRNQWHARINRHLMETLVVTPLDRDLSASHGRADHVQLIPYLFHVTLPDCAEQDLIQLPLIGKAGNAESFFNLLNHLAQDLQHDLNMTPVQADLFLRHHLVLWYLMIQFNRDEKFGRDFFQTHYSVDLMQTFFPTLTGSQAQRFYYWGILKFRPDGNLIHWETADNFKQYLDMFCD